MILNQISKKIENQIKLDQRTGKMVIQLRASLITLRESRHRLEIAKTAMLSGCVYLPACPALQRTYEIHKKIEEQIQRMVKIYWQTLRMQWPGQFPEFPEGPLPHLIQVFISQGSIKSGAEIRSVQHSGAAHAWNIAWIQ